MKRFSLPMEVKISNKKGVTLWPLTKKCSDCLNYTTPSWNSLLVLLPVRFTQRISNMGRNFNVIPIEIGESLNEAFLCSIIKAISLLLWRFHFPPIAINRIQPAFFVGKRHVEWDDLLALTELDFVCFARPDFLWQEHQNKLIFILMDFIIFALRKFN